MPDSDELLLKRYKQGDTDAFRDLVERYVASIYNLSLRLLRDGMEAENVVQETFLRVMTSLERTRLDLPFKPYLYRIAINLCYDILRARKRVITSEMELTEDLVEQGPGIADLIEKEEQRQQLLVALESLPPHYRAAIVLRYTEELSYEEIAKVLNIPLNTVRTHLRRAKAHLRSVLQSNPVPEQRLGYQMRAAEGG